MNKWKTTLEKMSMAVPFAEAAEYDTAMAMAGIRKVRKSHWRRAFEKVFTAAAFAEAGCPETARDILGVTETRPVRPSLEDFLQSVGLYGAKVRFGLVTVE